MKRYHFIELHEQRWMPQFLREYFVESLSAVLRMNRVYAGIPSLFARWLEESGGRQVLDLASGAAGPTAGLISDLERMGLEPPEFCLSDLFPSVDKFDEWSRVHPGRISFIREPVNALCVGQPHGRELRQIVSAFHHFRPEQARLILEDAVRNSKGICILEPFRRDWLHLVIGVMTLFPALIAPFFARRWKAGHFLTSVVVPVVPLMLVFDAVVSVLRCHSKSELQEMIDSLASDEFDWSLGSTRYLLIFSTAYVFGWRRAGVQGHEQLKAS